VEEERGFVATIEMRGDVRAIGHAGTILYAEDDRIRDGVRRKGVRFYHAVICTFQPSACDPPPPYAAAFATPAL